jgi:hypothetical protein
VFFWLTLIGPEWLFAVALAPLLPTTADIHALFCVGAAFAFLALWRWGVGLSLACVLELLHGAPDSACRATARAMRKEGLRPKRLVLLCWVRPLVLAWPSRGVLALTSGALATLEKEELCLVCARAIRALHPHWTRSCWRWLGLVAFAPLLLARALGAALWPGGSTLVWLVLGFLATAVLWGLHRQSLVWLETKQTRPRGDRAFEPVTTKGAALVVR